MQEKGIRVEKEERGNVIRLYDLNELDDESRYGILVVDRGKREIVMKNLEEWNVKKL